MVNFEKLEVNGLTKEEALGKAPFFIQGDATQAFKKWKATKVDGVKEKDITNFCLDYLNKKTKYAPGSGFYITLEAASKNTRERPYKLENVKNEQGDRKWKTTYQIVNDETGMVEAETTETQAKARELAKELYTKQGSTANYTCVITKQVVKGEPVAFKIKYTPSTGAHAGTYLVFGVKA